MSQETTMPCAVCDGKGGTYGPGYVADGRHVEDGMWRSCDWCHLGEVRVVIDRNLVPA